MEAPLVTQRMTRTTTTTATREKNKIKQNNKRYSLQCDFFLLSSVYFHKQNEMTRTKIIEEMTISAFVYIRFLGVLFMLLLGRREEHGTNRKYKYQGVFIMIVSIHHCEST